MRFALTYSIFFWHSLPHFETCSVFSFFLGLFCNRFISFLILSISFCISFFCRFGLFILCPYLYYTMPEKKILYTGEVNLKKKNFIIKKQDLDGCSLDGCFWLLTSQKNNNLFCCLWTSKKNDSLFCYFEQVKKIIVYFADFEQVKNNCSFCWLWTSLKNLISKLLWGETRYQSIFLGHYLVSQALHPGISDPWRSPPALSSTPTQGYFFLFECLGIQFLNSLTSNFWDAMLCCRSLILLPRVAEDLPKGNNHSKQMPLFTYLAWL